MAKFASRGLLMFTGGMAGLGAGLSNASRDYAQHVGRMDLEQERNRWDLAKVKLADSLAMERDRAKMEFEAGQNELQRKHEMGIEGQRLAGELDKAKLVGGFGLQERQLANEGAMATTKYSADTQRDVSRERTAAEMEMSERNRQSELQMHQEKLAQLDRQLAANTDLAGRELGLKEKALVQEQWKTEFLAGKQDERDIRQHIHELKQSQNQHDHEKAQLLEKGLQEQRQLREALDVKQQISREELANRNFIAQMQRNSNEYIARLQDTTEKYKVDQGVSTADKDRAAETERQQAALGAGLVGEMMRGQTQRDVAAAGDRAAMDRELVRSQTSKETTQMGVDADRYKVDMAAVNNTLLKAMDLQEASQFLTDRDGKLHIFSRNGQEIDASMYSATGQPVQLPLDKTGADLVVVKAVLSNLNSLYNQLESGNYEDREGLMNRILNHERIFYGLTGSQIRESKNYDLTEFHAGPESAASSPRSSSSPAASESGFGFGDILRGALPGQTGGFLQQWMGSTRKPSGLVNAPAR